MPVPSLPSVHIRSYLSVVGLLLLTLSPAVAFAETNWRIGLSAVRITPEERLPMYGYNRDVSEGVLDDLDAKAMAIEDTDGSLAVLLTADLLFFRAPMAKVICDRIMEQTGLSREQILLNASHTHAGPVFAKDPGRFNFPEDQQRRVQQYTEKLTEQLVQLVPAAIADLKPGRISWSTGEVDFVMNRRRLKRFALCAMRWLTWSSHYSEPSPTVLVIQWAVSNSIRNSKGSVKNPRCVPSLIR